MNKIKLNIGNKEVVVNPTYSIWMWTLKKYDIANMTDWSMAYYDSYIMDALWKIMVRNKIFKPFVFKFIMKNAVTMSQMKRLRIDIQRLLLGQNILSDEEFQKMLDDEFKELSKPPEKKK